MLTYVWTGQLGCWRVCIRTENVCQEHWKCTRPHIGFVQGLHRRQLCIVRRCNLCNILLLLLFSIRTNDTVVVVYEAAAIAGYMDWL